MTKNIDVSIVVISFNTKDITIDCLKSVVNFTKDVNYELIVVDNASTDGSDKAIEEFSKKHKNTIFVKKKNNLGFGGGNNVGMERAKGRYILLLNSDTKLHEDSISAMVEWMDANSDAGVATCQLKNIDRSIQATGGKFPTLLRVVGWSLFLDDIPMWSRLFGSYHPHIPSSAFGDDYYRKSHVQDWITGAFMMIKQEAYESVGGFDSKFFMYTEDVEYSYRFRRQGWKIWYVPITSILHIGGASSSGAGVEFSDKVIGKESSVVGEFVGLKLFYKKHFPGQCGLARIIMKTGAILRIFVFGFLQGQSEARKIYAKAFQSI